MTLTSHRVHEGTLFLLIVENLKKLFFFVARIKH